MIATHHAGLPDDAVPYRRIGPFTAETLPKGLLRMHSLAAGVWGVLRLERGSADFVWEDGSCRVDELAAPAELVIPPEVPHHLAAIEAVRLTVTFYRA